MATPASRSLAPRPPEKGVFPLDHFGECKEVQTRYMACLKEHKFAAEPCRIVSKEYLECRMSKGLMAQEDLRKLGFKAQMQNSGDGGAGAGAAAGGNDGNTAEGARAQASKGVSTESHR